ncbi:MAG: hypothetical protein ACPGEG_08060 [Salibacteraceae bacterium]
MIWRKVHNAQLDADCWNNCVHNSKNEHIYGYTWYLNIVSEDWVGYVLNDYQAVFAVPVRKKLGVLYVFQPEFYQRSDVFGNYNKDSLDALSSEILKSFSKINITTAIKLFEPSEVLKNLILQDYEEQKTSTNTLRNIKKANNNGCQVIEGGNTDCDDAINLFVTNTKYALAKDFKFKFASLTRVLHNNSGLVIKKVIIENKAIAYAVCAKSKSRLTLILLATSAESKTKGAAHMVVQAMVDHSKSLNLIFDFEGSNNPGIARFYKSFGAKVESYFYFDQKLVLGLKNRLLKKA